MHYSLMKMEVADLKIKMRKAKYISFLHNDKKNSDCKEMHLTGIESQNKILIPKNSRYFEELNVIIEHGNRS